MSAEHTAVEILACDQDEAERFRRGKGGKYDRGVAHLAHSFARHRITSLNTRKPDANADLLAALILAANRLQRIAVELIADGNSAHFEVSEWVEESRAAITKAQTGEAA